MTLKQKITKGWIGLALVGTMASMYGYYNSIPDKVERPPVVREYNNLTAELYGGQFVRPEVVGSLCEGYGSLMSNPESARSLQEYVRALDDFHEQDKKTIPFIVLMFGLAGMMGLGIGRYQSERQEKKERK